MPELGEKRVVNHEGRIEEEEVLDNVTDGEREGQGEHGPLGHLNESLDANVQKKVVALDEEDPKKRGSYLKHCGPQEAIV